MTIHTHPCERCGDHYQCLAPVEQGQCVSRLETSPEFRQCFLCNQGELPCDACDGERRGRWHCDLGQVLCEECEANEAEAAQARRDAEYYGGDTPQSDDERHQAAATVKREGR